MKRQNRFPLLGGGGLRGRGIILLTLLFAAAPLSAAPVLFEAYQEGYISIPPDERDTLTVAEVSFSVDTACYVQLAVGGIAQFAKVWCEVDGESLPPVAPIAATTFSEWFNITYSCLLAAGEHSISLRLANYRNSSYPTVLRDAYLQALIFLPDTATGAVVEQPMSDAQPSTNTPSLISRGPYVNVAGATELVDATGRVIENAITEDDKVYISNLPTGTYFARDGERTIVKIVKVN